MYKTITLTLLLTFTMFCNTLALHIPPSKFLPSEPIDEEVSIMEVIKEAINQQKDKLSNNPNVENVLNRLKELKQQVPTDKASYKEKLDWITQISKTLFSLGKETMLPVMERTYKVILKMDFKKDIWDKLTWKQRIQVSAIAPSIIIALIVGNIGISMLGTAFGVPVIAVAIFCIFATQGLIAVVFFVDYVIEFLGSLHK